MLIMEREFWKLEMALDYCHFQYLFYILQCPFWLEHDSILVNDTDFTLSKLRCLIFTNSKLLSLFSHYIVQWFSSCWTSCTVLLPLDDLWPCLCLCMVLHTVLNASLTTFATCYAMGGHCLSGCPVPQYLQFSIFLFLFPSPFHCLLLSCFCLSPLTESNFCTFDIVQQLFFCPLHLHPLGPQQYLFTACITGIF